MSVVAKILSFLLVIFLLAGVPFLSHLTTRDEDLLLLPRKSLYFSAVVSQWLLGAVTAVIAAVTSEGQAVLRTLDGWTFIKWTAGIVILALSAMGLTLLLEGKGWWPRESRWVVRLMPETGGEKRWAVFLLAPTAAVCEEFIYRGYLLLWLARYLHSMDAAWVISSIAFGLAHVYQRVQGFARAALFGILLAYPVIHLGSLYPSMAAHFLIDAVALAWLGPAALKQADRS